MKRLAGICSMAGWLAVLGCAGQHKRSDSSASPDLTDLKAPEAAATKVAGVKVAGVTVTNQIEAGLLRPAQNWFTLGPGDRVELEVLGRPATRTITAVGPD